MTKRFQDGDRLMPIHAVMHTLGVSRSNIYYMMENGDFPKPIKVGRKRVVWIAREVNEYIQRQIDARDSGDV